MKRRQLTVLALVRARLALLAAVLAILPVVTVYSDDHRFAAIRALNNTEEIWVWYVERNSAGKHGYAGQDTRFNSLFVDGTELVPTIAAFKAALRAQGLNRVRFITGAPAVRPPVRARALTDLELKQLRE